MKRQTYSAKDLTIQVTRSSIPTLDEYVAEIAPLWESYWLTNMGVKHVCLLSSRVRERADADCRLGSSACAHAADVRGPVAKRCGSHL